MVLVFHLRSLRIIGLICTLSIEYYFEYRNEPFKYTDNYFVLRLFFSTLLPSNLSHARHETKSLSVPSEHI